MKDFKKYYIINAKPEIVYAALTNPYTIKLWSGEEAKMSTEVNSEFSLWEESITGVNLEFELNKKIVQRWDFGEQSEPSIVTIKLHEHKHGTSLELRHINIPDEDYIDIAEGWDYSYVGSLIDFYEE